MLKMVDGTGIIGVDMICPLGVSTPQPPNYDRVELEGAGMLVLPNSLDAPLERLELGGKTEQVTTTGAQLFEASRYEGVTKNGVTVTVKDGVITATGTPNINTWIQVFVSRENYQKLFKPENKIYLKTNKSKDCNYDFGIYGAFGSPIIGTIREGNSGRVLPAELPRNDTDFYFFIDVKIGTELKGSIKPIVYHDGDGTWEPYTGGKPSPSQEYQQEIKNVGKWNEEKQKYEVEVVLSGKNLLDITACEDGKTLDANGNIVNNANALLSDFIPCFSKTSYCRVGGHFTAVSFYDVEKNKIGSINQYDPCFATPDKCRYFRFSLNKTKADYEKAVANVGTALMDYEPYKKPQFLTLTSDRPLTKWDRLVEQGGQYGWLYKHKIIEDFSTLVKDTEAIYGNDGGKYFSVSLQNASLNYDISKIYSEAGVYGKDNKIHYIPKPMKVNAIIHVSDTDTIMTAKEHMHYKVIYETTESQFVPLPQSEQNAIRALKTYYPTTVITVDGGEVDPDIKVTYRKEI